MPGQMVLRIFNVDHGACAMLTHNLNGKDGRLAMIDCGNSKTWSPSEFIRNHLRRTALDYLFITNADQDHISDLDGLMNGGIYVPVFHRNPSLTSTVFQTIKGAQGNPLTDDGKRYAAMCDTFTGQVTAPFDQSMGGITCSMFFNAWPHLLDTNNLSLAIFFRYCGFKILFPGDLEQDGWLALLDQPGFKNELATVDVLVASHHGRENGYCEEVFKYCKPQVVVMSDKEIKHGTQETMASKYGARVRAHHPNGVFVSTSGQRRYVLTTRDDGWIEFHVNDKGGFDIFTEQG